VSDIRASSRVARVSAQVHDPVDRMCAGALVESEYVAKLRSAGFRDVTVDPTRIYDKDDAAEMASSCGGGDMSELWPLSTAPS